MSANLSNSIEDMDKPELLAKIASLEAVVKDTLSLHLATTSKQNESLKLNIKKSDTIQQQRKLQFLEKDKELVTKHLESAPSILESFNKILLETEARVSALQEEVEEEKAKNLLLKKEITSLKGGKFEHPNEEDEEGIYSSKNLLRRIKELVREKEDLLVKVEAEEEMITNTLMKKLNTLQKEKVEMELMLEQEQEFIVNRLTKQLERLKQQQGPPPSSSFSPTMKAHHRHSSFSPTASIQDFHPSPSPAVVEMLNNEVQFLKTKIQNSEDSFLELIKRLKNEVLDLRTKLGKDTSSIDREYSTVTLVRTASSSSTSTTNSLSRKR